MSSSNEPAKQPTRTWVDHSAGRGYSGSASGLRTGSRRLWAAIGAGGLALIAGIVTAVVLLSSSAPVAYAGWTPTPTPATLGGRDPSVQSPAAPQRLATIAWQAGADRRAWQVHRRDVRVRHLRHASACQTATAGQGSEGDALVLGFYAAPGPDQLGLPSGGSGALNGFSAPNTNQPLPEPFQRILHAIQNPTLRARHAAVFRQLLADGVETNVYGRAGSDIAAVTFAFSDGITVDATVQNGWYFAWWPGVDQPASVQVITKSGQHINSQMPGPPPVSVGPAAAASSRDCNLTQILSFAVPTPGVQNLPRAGAPPRNTATNVHDDRHHHDPYNGEHDEHTLPDDTVAMAAQLGCSRRSLNRVICVRQPAAKEACRGRTRTGRTGFRMSLARTRISVCR